MNSILLWPKLFTKSAYLPREASRMSLQQLTVEDHY